MTTILKRSLLWASLLFVAIALSLGFTGPPRPVPASASFDVVSAERAMTHVNAIAERPHPIGSADHARVRDYVMNTLEGLGLEATIQRTTGVTAKYRAAGAVENVVARLHGASAGGVAGSVMLAAHYDSVAAGPGAGDDASGVAAILEAVRALKTAPPPLHDVIVLISDGEETGLLGASAFMAEHPWASDVRVVVNLEARGTRGVSSLFETSAANGELVSEAAGADPSLAGSSLAYEVYKRMPNDTDATVFKAQGKAALNFAFVGNEEAYHTPQDDPGHLDLRSLQQQCDAAFGLARRFGDADLEHLSGADAVFFSLPGGLFVHYPHGVAVALAIVAVVLLASRARASWGRGDATIGGMAAGLGAFALQYVVALGLGFAMAYVQGRLHGAVLREGDVKLSAFYASAIVMSALGGWGLVFLVVRRWLSAEDVALGSGAALVSLTIGTSLVAPGVSFLFALPALGAVAPRHRTIAAVAALAGIVTVIPLMQGVFEGLGVTAPGGALLGGLTVIVAGSLAGPLDAVIAPAPRRLGLFPFAVAVVLFVVGMATTRTSVAHPKASRLWYVADADKGTGRWASSATRGDAWIDSFVGTHPATAPLFPGWTRPWLQGDERPMRTITLPKVRLLGTTSTREGRGVQLLVSPGPGPDAVLELATDADIVNATVNRKAAPATPGQPWTLTFANADPDGILVELDARGRGPVHLSVIVRRTGLPAGDDVTPRPAWSVPNHGGDQTVVRKTFAL